MAQIEQGLSKPRVLHVYKDYFPPVLGGVETTIRLMALGMKQQFQISVLVNSGSSKSFTEEVEGIRVRRVGEWGRLASAPISPQFIRALRQEAKTADLLHFHHPNPTGDAALLLCGFAGPVQEPLPNAVEAHVQNICPTLGGDQG